MAPAGGRYDLVPAALRAAAERGAGQGLAEDPERLRALPAGLGGPGGRQSS
ncbi:MULTISPECIES: hypothetical protein [Streptomyces]|uniref:Uncharacterized protein n=1 Tax=Streptomyces changanensis TaxID=2964669 RepID=A0ABY5N415_9ACTN|nr:MULTISPECIES: hypothetical protein [Streptomyces]UUS31275.1 hypothetical protein NRO40_10800 [Streptomyces changanensis]